MKPKPIEIDFPIEQVNEIAEREAHAKEKYHDQGMDISRQGITCIRQRTALDYM